MSKKDVAADVLIEDLVVGQGQQAVGAGQTLLVHYTGWLEDGSQFDSSKPRGEPFSFPLDVGFVIRGWDQGVKGMREGGTRRLIIAPQLGYGARGAGDIIPPNATLTFEIELVAISE
jgi:FKBP-type peptidyl-prolyl cis-trans isomerase